MGVLLICFPESRFVCILAEFGVGDEYQGLTIATIKKQGRGTMIMTRAQQQSAKVYRDHVLGVMGFHETAQEVLDANHITEIT